MLIPFKVSFLGREDRDLRPALEHEPEHQAAILAWIVRGAVRYYNEGLEPPDVVTTATAAYEQESDPLSDFLTTACELNPEAEVGARMLFKHYADWAEQNGLTTRERLSATMFGRKMTDRFKSDKTMVGKVYFGVGIRNP